MKTIVHVNESVIKKNRKSDSRDPVLTVKTYKSNDYGHEVIITNAKGEELAKLIYNPDKPLSCGAQVWLETQFSVQVINYATQ